MRCSNRAAIELEPNFWAAYGRCNLCYVWAKDPMAAFSDTATTRIGPKVTRLCFFFFSGGGWSWGKGMTRSRLGQQAGFAN